MRKLQVILAVRKWLRVAILFGIIFARLAAQDTNRVTLMFVGDIMVHAKQITGAYYGDHYDFMPCFQYIREEFDSADYVVGNLEGTFSGEPYGGYPNFRMPDELASALRQTGINCLTTANNHAFDGYGDGMERTLRLLDSLGIAHIGTYTDSLDRNAQTPLIIKKNNIRIAFLNYTYGTNNGIQAEIPAVISRIQRARIEADVNKARLNGADIVTIYFHWGREYESVPEKFQTDLAFFCHNLGVEIIVASHPHVLQRMEAEPDSTDVLAKLTAYSLGNLISDYITPERTGSAILKIVLEKRGNAVKIIEAGYILTWVVRVMENGRQRYFVIPADRLSTIDNLKPTADQQARLKRFLLRARRLLKTGSGYLPEYRWNAERQIWYAE
ncbi:MAG: CapA family protein [Candidatus Neomarinimicrobiota bacterium]